MKRDLAELKLLAQAANSAIEPFTKTADGERWEWRDVCDLHLPELRAFKKVASPSAILALIKRLETLEECLKTMFGYMESGFLVRDTTHDSEPGWAIRMLQFTVDLGKCYRAISAPDAAELEKEAAAIKEVTE